MNETQDRLEERRAEVYIEVRRVISDAYYEARNDGETMEHAADNAAEAVMGLAALRQSQDIEAAGLDVGRLARAIHAGDCIPNGLGMHDVGPESYCTLIAPNVAAEYAALAPKAEEAPHD